MDSVNVNETLPNSSESGDGEYAHERVPHNKLLSGSYFAAGYSGEHVAGGEFVVGAAFAAWGAAPMEVVMGLIIGNLLAVLSWALACSPIATRSRITLYHYIERMAGKQFTFVYNLLNGIIFAVLAGGMMTISASAVRGLTNAPQQIHWYPTSALFVFLVLIIGVATVYVTIRGFKAMAQFAKLCAPWLLVIFLVCGLASLPFLLSIGKNSGVSGVDVFSHYVWTGRTPDGSPSFSIWHIAAFAWGLNLPLHLGMGDLSTLRFARSSKYGYYSAFAAYGGHFVAWLTCGILGAATAAMLNTSIGKLDIGGVVVPILGITGTAAVVIASLTTAVPSLYRAGLAFQALFNKASVVKVTTILGAITTVFACFPFIFLKWLDLMAYFNITLAPVGAMILVEHFILPRMGIMPFWREKQTDLSNKAAWIVWGIGIAVAAFIVSTNIMHLFFVFIPVYIVCLVMYVVFAKMFATRSGANESMEALYSRAYGDDVATTVSATNTTTRTANRPNYAHPLFLLAVATLVLTVVVSAMMFMPADPFAYSNIFKWVLALLSVAYFVFMASWSKLNKAKI